MTTACAASNKAQPIPLVAPLAELTRQDHALAGGKAVNLGEMIRARLPVPAGFCVTTAAYLSWFHTSSAACSLLDRLSRVTPDQTDPCRDIAEQLRQELATVPIPEAVQAAVRAALGQHPLMLAWAVRSSATVEDLPAASFAGQHDSFLNVRGVEGVLESVRRCWISLFADRAVIYRLRNRVPHRDAAMAVVVQEMIPAEVSGVLFTADPVTGDTGRIVIEGVKGLGEALVSGKANPDRVELDKSTLHVSTRYARPQGFPMAPAPAGVGGQGTLAEPTQGARCLDEALAERLGELALQVERLFGGAQDIEWAAGANEVFLLQARPVTTLPVPRESDPDIWTNANAMEALPDVVTPMSWSVLEILVNDFLQPLLRRMGLNAEGRPLAGLIAGRAYLNLRVLAELFKVSGPACMDFRSAFGGPAAGWPGFTPAAASQGRVTLRLRALARLPRLLVWLLPSLPRQRQLIERWGERTFGDLAHISPVSLSDAQLAKHPRALLRLACTGEGERTWAAAVWMAVGAVGASTAIFRLARRWLGDADGSLANRLISGAGGMNSAENGLELLRLAAWARELPALKTALLDPLPFAQLEPKLPGLPHGAAFLERWQTFMERHGHQARGGMDVAQPRWSEMPDFVLDMLRAYLRFSEEEDPLTLQVRRQRKREELLTHCQKRLRNPIRRRLFVFLLGASRRGLAQRENVKNEGVRMVAIMRRALLEAGRRLVVRGLLQKPEDIFFLRLDELEPVLCGQPAFDLSAAITARQTEHARHQSFTPPSLVVGRYDPGLSAAELPPEGVRTLRGLAVSPGIVTGKARVILQADTNERVFPGEILVAPYTDPGWTPYFLSAAAVVVDVGGLLSHGSVVAREYGLPAVVNVGPATRLIRTGQMICVDGNRGLVTLADEEGSAMG